MPSALFSRKTFVSLPMTWRFAVIGIAPGVVVRLGSVRLHAEAFDRLQRGVVVVESVHPNRAFLDGIGINALISADATSPRGGGVFHDTAVWVKAG